MRCLPLGLPCVDSQAIFISALAIFASQAIVCAACRLGPVRWLVSYVEFGTYHIRPRPVTLNQLIIYGTCCRSYRALLSFSILIRLRCCILSPTHHFLHGRLSLANPARSKLLLMSFGCGSVICRQFYHNRCCAPIYLGSCRQRYQFRIKSWAFVCLEYDASG